MNKVAVLRLPLLVGLILVMATAGAWAAASQTLIWWMGDPTLHKDEYEFQAKLFEQQNPGVKVEVQAQALSQTDFMQKLAVAIAAGAAPDISWFEASSAPMFAAKGLLMDLTRVLDGLRFAPADTQEVTYAGKMWSVPYHTSVRGLFKRVDHFSEAGMNPNANPASLDELYEWNRKLIKTDANQKITRAGLIPWVGNWGAPGWIWTFGGKLLDIEGARIQPTATYQKNIDAFNWIRMWAQFYGNVAPVTAGHNGLQTGTISMSAESSSSIGRLEAAKVQFAISKVPNPPGGANGTWGGGSSIVVPVGAKNPDLAMKFARFLGETSTQLARYEMSINKLLPSNWQALLAVGRQLPAYWQPLLDQFPVARARPPLWIQYYVSYLNPAMNQVVAGKKLPEQALEEVQKTMEPLYQEIFGN